MKPRKHHCRPAPRSSASRIADWLTLAAAGCDWTEGVLPPLRGRDVCSPAPLRQGLADWATTVSIREGGTLSSHASQMTDWLSRRRRALIRQTLCQSGAVPAHFRNPRRRGATTRVIRPSKKSPPLHVLVGRLRAPRREPASRVELPRCVSPVKQINTKDSPQFWLSSDDRTRRRDTAGGGAGGGGIRGGPHCAGAGRRQRVPAGPGPRPKSSAGSVLGAVRAGRRGPRRSGRSGRGAR